MVGAVELILMTLVMADLIIKLMEIDEVEETPSEFFMNSVITVVLVVITVVVVFLMFFGLRVKACNFLAPHLIWQVMVLRNAKIDLAKSRGTCSIRINFNAK